MLDDGCTIDYDWLVLALGSDTATFGVPGVVEHCAAFNTYTDAVALDNKLKEVQSASGAPATAIVVGGGYAGVELAAVLAERLGAGRVRVVAAGAGILEAAPAGQREAAAAKLAAVGVEVVAGAAVKHVAGGEGGRVSVSLAAPSSTPPPSLDADVVVWTAGVAPSGAPAAPPGGPALPFPRTAAGAVRVDATLRVAGHPRVFALGDVAGADGGAGAAPTAQVAFQQADYAAWNVWAAIAGRPALPFKYQHLGAMMSLGAGDGAVTLPVGLPARAAAAVAASPLAPLLDAAGVRLSDPTGVTLAGPLGAALRRAAYWYRQPTGGQRAAVGAAWLDAAAKRFGAGRPPTMGGGSE